MTQGSPAAQSQFTNHLDDAILAVAVGTSAALRKPVQRLAVLAAGVGAVAVINSTDDDPDNDPAVIVDRVRHRLGDVGERPGPASDMPAGDLGSPARTWGVVAGVVLTVLAIARFEQRVLRSGWSRCVEGVAVGAATYQLCRHAR
ncbi:hypothetical protein [Corynebacterium epidermidicanis]|nr:hypothetical protein [Corynebacterium epidermidicanis]